MKEKKSLPTRIMVFLMIMTFVIVQTCPMSFSEESGAKLNDFLKITKKITKENGTVSNNYYLGELINVEYTIRSDEVTLDIPKEIAFVIDTTISMKDKTSGNSGETKFAALKRVFLEILNNWNIPNSKMCIVEFGPRVEKETPLLEATKANINNTFIKTVNDWNEGNLYTGTNLGDGLRTAYYKLLKSGNKNAKKYIITLTDGLPNMRTVDKNGTPYFGDESVNNNTKGIRTDPQVLTNDVKPYEKYACDIMQNISSTGAFTNFLIGFGIGSDQAITMNNVGKAGNAYPVSDQTGDKIDDYFYRPSNGAELKTVFDKIHESLMDPFQFSTADLIQDYPDTSLIVVDGDNDEKFAGIPDEYCELADKSLIKVASNKLLIPLKLKLKLKEGSFNKYTLDPQEVKFTIQFRVIKTGQIDLQPITGLFLFHNPVTGEAYTALSSDEKNTLFVKQTVNSIIIPPLVVFADGTEASEVNAIINPTKGLESADRQLKNWSIVDTENDDIGIFDIEDGTQNDTSAKVILKNNIQGIGKITAESSGYGYGAKSNVRGSGSVISIMPQVKNIEMNVAKSKEVSISSLLPDTLSTKYKQAFNSDLSRIMDNYYYTNKYYSEITTGTSTFSGSKCKIYPAGTDDLYLRFTQIPGKTTAPITIGNSNGNISDGIWIIKPEVSENNVYYRISKDGESSGNLSLSADSDNICWADSIYKGTDKDLQLWKIDLMEDGNYRISSKKTSKCITKSSTQVESKSYYGDQTQHWRIEKTDDLSDASRSEEKNIQSVLGKIEFEADDKTHLPIATADRSKSVKIEFGSDHTKLKITGKMPTVLNSKKIGDGKVIITANVIYKNIGVPGKEGNVSKGKVTFEAIIDGFVDIN
ncbi:MAG: VWA domain-containing protein [Bacillota bacterium]|nr:VWA domain-containing protein [Bacillota bacterium]